MFNNNAEWSNLLVFTESDGDNTIEVGETLSINWVAQDPDHITANNPNGWVYSNITYKLDIFGDNYIAGNGNYTISSSDIGKTIAYMGGYRDVLGNQENELIIAGTVSGESPPPPPQNNSASFSNATLTSGDHTVGKTLTANLDFTDADGMNHLLYINGTDDGIFLYRIKLWV